MTLEWLREKALPLVVDEAFLPMLRLAMRAPGGGGGGGGGGGAGGSEMHLDASELKGSKRASMQAHDSCSPPKRLKAAANRKNGIGCEPDEAAREAESAAEAADGGDSEKEREEEEGVDSETRGRGGDAAGGFVRKASLPHCR